MDNLPLFDPAPDQPIVVFGRPNCPMVPPVLRLLDVAGVAYDYVNVREDAAAADQLRAITGGFESVPTVVFPDGRALVEPSVMKLRQALQEESPDGLAPISTADAIRAALRNPVYLILGLLLLALILSYWIN